MCDKNDEMILDEIRKRFESSYAQGFNDGVKKITELKGKFNHQCENCQILMEDRVKDINELNGVLLDIIEHIQLDGSGFEFEDSCDYGADKTQEWQDKLARGDKDSEK